jgi:hypothetical protein
MAYDLFISHSADDKAIAGAVCSAPEAAMAHAETALGRICNP